MNDGYVKVIMASIIWGTIGIFARWSGADPLLLSFSRSFLTVPALLLFLYCKREALPWLRARDFFPVIISGVFRAAGLYFYFVAISLTSLCYTLIIFYLAPVMIVLLGPLFIGERFEKNSLYALFIAVCGIVFVLISIFDDHVSAVQLNGIINAFLGAVCFTFTVTIAKGLKKVNGLALTFYQMLVAAVCLLPFLNIREALVYILKIDAFKISSLLLLGIMHTALAYAIYHEGLKVVKIQHAGIFLYLDPVVASILGYLIFRETISLSGFLGAFLIIAAGIVVTVESIGNNTGIIGRNRC
jgi:drug/metabolite transporter (DMT)-like permease